MNLTRTLRLNCQFGKCYKIKYAYKSWNIAIQHNVTRGEFSYLIEIIICLCTSVIFKIGLRRIFRERSGETFVNLRADNYTHDYPRQDHRTVQQRIASSIKTQYKTNLMHLICCVQLHGRFPFNRVETDDIYSFSSHIANNSRFIRRTWRSSVTPTDIEFPSSSSWSRHRTDFPENIHIRSKEQSIW